MMLKVDFVQFEQNMLDYIGQQKYLNIIETFTEIISFGKFLQTYQQERMISYCNNSSHFENPI
jgi:hypothetical protein